jgi:uncharacterized damage-inducible protein DinB
MTDFLARPGSAGQIGALLDEYARAAEEFCRVVEGFDERTSEEGPPGDDAGAVSVLAICRHVCRAARGYADDLGEASGRGAARTGAEVNRPADVRSILSGELRFTEEIVQPLRGLSEEEVEKMEFRVSWGALYNPESLLEHAICHLLRHRRQLERL